MKITFLSSILLFSISFSQNNFVFPFSSGDLWQYNLVSADPFGPAGIETTHLGADTLMPNKQVYKGYYSNNVSNLFLRTEGSKVFQFWSLDSTEILRYDFSKQKGDTFSFIPIFNDSLPVVITEDTIINVFGDLRRMISFHSSNAFIGESIVDSIGIFSIDHGIDPRSQLLGAVISGKVYGTVTSVNTRNKPLSTKAHLSQNYPNPFNPVTIIQYDLPINVRVKIVIVNQLGQRVAVLVDSYKQAGSYQVEWNASQYASGIYYCTMRCDNFEYTTKLAVLK